MGIGPEASGLEGIKFKDAIVGFKIVTEHERVTEKERETETVRRAKVTISHNHP